VKPIRAELPVAQPVRMQATAATPKAGEELTERTEGRRVKVEVPARAPVVRALERPTEERVTTWPVEAPTRELGYVYIPAWRHEFTAPVIYPFVVRTFETPVRVFETTKVHELEVGRYDTWTAEVPERGVRVAEVPARRAEEGFSTPPPPPAAYVRGGYGWGRDSAHMLRHPPRFVRRGWRVYELLRI